MKEKYLSTMHRIVSVYSKNRIEEYIQKTRNEGITEHGFPRLCANIGILIAHDKLSEYLTIFEKMMHICCRDLPAFYPQKGKRGNDFSIREIVSCILELEKTSYYPQETIDNWKKAFRKFEPKDFYRMIAPYPPEPVDNWAAFNAASEQIRIFAGLANNDAFVENQIASQMFSFDENGMYRDPSDPMVYDLVTRTLLSACLHYGYNGSHKAKLEEYLRKAGHISLKFQSVSGEAAYGGRSNQFLHNEAHLAACFEFEANAHYLAGDHATAGQFKAAANLARSTLDHFLDFYPDRHIKNNYPIDSMIGCENYAYYDKYMITAASFLYLAHEFCNEEITATICPAEDNSQYAWATSDAFRKVFCKSGPYFLEAEWRSDAHYDASGIGRVHRRGAPSAICLSAPAALSPSYKIEKENPLPLSICCGAKQGEIWHYCSEEFGKFELINLLKSPYAGFTFLGKLDNQKTIIMEVVVAETGVNISLQGTGTIGLLIPAFWFDGKNHTDIVQSDRKLSVRYQGWTCNYLSNSLISDLNCICANRNGKYKLYRLEAENMVHLKIQIQQ